MDFCQPIRPIYSILTFHSFRTIHAFHPEIDWDMAGGAEHRILGWQGGMSGESSQCPFLLNLTNGTSCSHSDKCVRWPAYGRLHNFTIEKRKGPRIALAPPFSECHIYFFLPALALANAF